MNFDRGNTRKKERIGKKYQWIAMHNILARIADVHQLDSWGWNDKICYPYKGAWQLNVRDFDPTLNTKMQLGANKPNINLPEYGKESFIVIDASESDINKWIVGSDKMFTDFGKRLINVDSLGNEWITLYCYQENKLEPEIEKMYSSGISKGEQHIWCMGIAYLVSDRVAEDKLMSVLANKNHIYDVKSYYSLYSREYAWSSAYKCTLEEQEDDTSRDDIKIIPATINKLWEAQYDASQEETTSFIIPTGEIVQDMNLTEKQVDGVYYHNDEIVALDLITIGNKEHELVIRKDILDAYLQRNKLKLIVVACGEKQYFLGDCNQKWNKYVGYFKYDKNKFKGQMEIADDN